MTTYRVLLADDHPLFREGVARTLSDSPVFEVAGEAANARDAVDMARRLGPDMVLLDLSMPGGGLSALKEIAALDPAPTVALLTVSEDNDHVLEALAAGATGYILKGVGSRELLRVLQDLAEGQTYVAPSLAAKVLARMNSPRAAGTPRDPMDDLTPREQEILRLVAEGRSNKEVARTLGLQEKTVKHYMTAILGKLQVRNRTEAALLAERHWRGA